MGSRVELIISASSTILEILSNVLIMCAVMWKCVREVGQGDRVFLIVVILDELGEPGFVSLEVIVLERHAYIGVGKICVDDKFGGSVFSASS